ncbi:hypothetical protein BH10PLA2_BH10PLA2_07580 [soil metagenome]
MDHDVDVLESDLPTTLADLRLQPQGLKDKVKESDEESCPAFGYLRGLKDRALSIEFRFADGHSLAYSYTLLAEYQHNPSAGILLKFLGDKVTLLVIQGSNLNAAINGISLYDRGLLRHRITFVQEMSREQLKRAGEREPTIDRIRVTSHRSDEAAPTLEWLKPFVEIDQLNR